MNPRHYSWADYGGRGIKICPAWRHFTTFLKDVGMKPAPHLTLDRINNDGDYEPSNVRWVDMTVQNNNRRIRQLDHPKHVYPSQGGYVVKFTRNRVKIYGGWWKTIEEAVIARDTLLKQ
jgi:hypothetical protein